MKRNQAGMKNQEAVSQTGGTISAKVLRHEGSQRLKQNQRRMTGDARHQDPECTDITHSYPFKRDSRLSGSEQKLKK